MKKHTTNPTTKQVSNILSNKGTALQKDGNETFENILSQLKALPDEEQLTAVRKLNIYLAEYLAMRAVTISKEYDKSQGLYKAMASTDLGKLVDEAYSRSQNAASKVN